MPTPAQAWVGQVPRKPREADRMLSESRHVAEVTQALATSDPTYHRWRNQYGAMKTADVKRWKEPERQNQRLKRIVANQALDLRGELRAFSAAMEARWCRSSRSTRS